MPTGATIVVTDYNFADLAMEQAVLAGSGCNLIGHHCKDSVELIF